MTPAVAAVLTGLLGLLVGSFLAAVSVRLPKGEGVVAGRSRCPGCDQALRAWELVPVLSWLALRGRCARCVARISPRYPLIELGAAALGVWAALHGDGLLALAAGVVLGWQLLLIAVVDGENFWLPDILTWPLAATGVLFALGEGWEAALWRVAAVATGFAGLWLIGWLYRRLRGREGLGGGDPFLMAGAGAWVGLAGLPSVLLWASAAGLSVVFALLVVRRRVAATDRLPFGVFLAIGTWLTWLYGPLGG